MLSAIDVDKVSGYDRIRALRAHQRMASHYAAHIYRDMTAVVDAMEVDENEEGFAAEAAAAEVRAARRLTRRAADSEMSFAVDLQRRLPLVWQALCAGAIDVRRARMMAHGTALLPLAAARDLIDHLIADAGLLTTGQLSARICKLAIEVDAEDAARRYEQAVAERRIVTEPTEAGTANLFGIDLPPHRLAAGMKRINKLARSRCGNGETRTTDQLRVDVLLNVLKGTKTASRSGRGTVNIHVDLTTLTQLAEHPGELTGYGPVIADIARQVAERQQQSEWQYTVTDPITGQPIDVGTTRSRPTAQQRRHVQLRDTTCVFSGCRMPAVDCDIDHRIPRSEGGPTSTHYLASLCRHDHNTNRHRIGWTYRPLANSGYLWTSRLGHTYTTSGRSP